MIDFTHDGHVHTPFCPHGSNDSFDAYIERAIERGLKTITFTEHAPLPASFVDPTPQQDSAMPFHRLDAYIEALDVCKRRFADVIDVRIGLEIDLLPGLERDTIALLQPYRSRLDETILSQHFLYVDDTYYPVDFSADAFDVLVRRLGSFEALLRTYYTSLTAGLDYAWETLNVRRIGHLDLPIKYQLNYSFDRAAVKVEETELLQWIAIRGFGLDLNTAGLRKPECKAIYTSTIWQQARDLNIPFTLGSDAHVAFDVAAGFDVVAQKKATFI